MKVKEYYHAHEHNELERRKQQHDWEYKEDRILFILSACARHSFEI